MINNKFKGTGVALVTPFNKDLSIDFDGLTRLVEHVIKGGVDFLVPLGSTGESATLSETEQRSVLDHVIKVNASRLPIVAGNFGGTNTKTLVEKISNYNFDGIDAILSSSPAYVKPSQEGIYEHYMSIERSSPVPIIIYNVPGRTKSNIDWQTTIRLANASHRFIAIKEASGDLIQITKIIQNKPADFLVISGDDETTLAMMACGGEGVISVIANALPANFSQMINACLEGDFQLAKTLNLRSYNLHHWLYLEGNPVGIKAAMEALEVCERQVRLPLSRMTSANFDLLKSTLKEIAGK